MTEASLILAYLDDDNDDDDDDDDDNDDDDDDHDDNEDVFQEKQLDCIAIIVLNLNNVRRINLASPFGYSVFQIFKYVCNKFG